jgi:glycosyltransferase involved in cell wall biosynthesis
VICTHNRPTYLKKCLGSIISQGIHPDQYEIILMDNSTDGRTKNLIDEEFHDVTQLRYETFSRPSGNFARNAGVPLARGRIVAFIDDDAIAEPGWLQAIIDSFTDKSPVACIGGPSSVIFEAARPIWLSDWLLPFLGELHYGHTSKRMRPDQMFFGLNIAFDRKALVQSGIYEESLDRGRYNLLSNSEYPMQMNIEQNGYERWYVPAMCVRHHAPASRLTMAWILQRVWWQGISDARMKKAFGAKRSILKRSHDHHPTSRLRVLIPTFANLFLLLAVITLYAGYAMETITPRSSR